MDSGSGASAAVSVVPVVPASPVRVRVAAVTKVSFDEPVAGSQEPGLNAPTPAAIQYSAAAAPTPQPLFGTPDEETNRGSELSKAQALTFAALVLLTCVLPIVCARRTPSVWPTPLDIFAVRGPADWVAFATFLPAIAAVAYVARTQTQQALLSLWGRFAYGWLVLLPAFVFAASICVFLLVEVLTQFPSPLDNDTPQSWVFWGAAITFCCAAVELALLSFAIPSKDKLTNLANSRRRALNAIFTVLGLGTSEAYFSVLFSQRVADPADRSAYLVRILISFIVILIPMQVLGSYHIGLGIAYREAMKTARRPLRCIFVPFASRWAFLFVVLALPLVAKSQSVGLCGFLLVPLYLLVVRNDRLRLPRAAYGVLRDSTA